jgi:hypothetical protein
LPREEEEAEGRMVVMEEEGRRDFDAPSTCGRRCWELLKSRKQDERLKNAKRDAKRGRKTHEGPATAELDPVELQLLNE